MTQAILIRKSDPADPTTWSPVGNVLTDGAGLVPHPDRSGGRLVSPVTIGWEDDEFRVAAFVGFEPPAGKVEDGPRLKTYDDASNTVIETAPVADAPPPPPRRLAKLAIIERLTEDQIARVLGAMTLKQQERWRAAPDVRADPPDPEMVALLSGSLGLSDTQIAALLAPEERT